MKTHLSNFKTQLKYLSIGLDKQRNNLELEGWSLELNAMVVKIKERIYKNEQSPWKYRIMKLQSLWILACPERKEKQAVT